MSSSAWAPAPSLSRAERARPSLAVSEAALSPPRAERASAWPDEFGLIPARREERADARAALFRLHAELFVNAPSRDRETIRSFEALALGFMPRLDLENLTALARQLAPCEDTPAPVLAYLVQRSAATRTLVLTLAPTIPAAVADLFIGENPAGAAALARHPRLDRAAQQRLAVMEEAGVDAALAGNAAIALSEPVLRQLLARSALHPEIGRALLGRPDLTVWDEASLYCAADPVQRARIVERIESSAHVQRPRLPARLSAAEADALLQCAQAGDVLAFEADLNEALGLDPETPWHLLQPERQELLALAFAVLGIEEDTAIRIFLTLHPTLSHSVRSVFALTDAFRAVAPAPALAILEAVFDQTITRTGLRPPATRLLALESEAPAPVPAALLRAPVAPEAEPQRLAS
jgi:hypothetical protein